MLKPGGGGAGISATGRTAARATEVKAKREAIDLQATPKAVNEVVIAVND